MKVIIKKFAVEMEVKTAGIEFEVRSPDGENHIGDCVLTKTAIEWCEGRRQQGNGVKVKWEQFRELTKSDAALHAALHAARQH